MGAVVVGLYMCGWVGGRAGGFPTSMPPPRRTRHFISHLPPQTPSQPKPPQAIARQCGILTRQGKVLEGPQFRTMTPAQLDEVLPKLQVRWGVVDLCWPGPHKYNTAHQTLPPPFPTAITITKLPCMYYNNNNIHRSWPAPPPTTSTRSWRGSTARSPTRARRGSGRTRGRSGRRTGTACCPVRASVFRMFCMCVIGLDGPMYRRSTILPPTLPPHAPTTETRHTHPTDTLPISPSPQKTNTTKTGYIDEWAESRGGVGEVVGVTGDGTFHNQ